jgi:hypothetical protein
MTVAEFIATHDLGFTCERVGPKLYRCRITCEDRGMGFYHNSPTVPTLAEVLTRLAVAAREHVNTKLPTGLSANRDEASFRHWCMLYGHDPLSDAVRMRYLVIRRKAEQLKYVIGIPAYHELLTVA